MICSVEIKRVDGDETGWEVCLGYQNFATTLLVTTATDLAELLAAIDEDPK